MDKIALLIEEKQNFHCSGECFCQYCSDTGLQIDFIKIHTNYLCPNCYLWAKGYELEEPTWLEYMSYPEYVQRLILSLNNAADIIDFFGVILTTDNEKMQYILKDKIENLKSIIFKTPELIYLIKKIKIDLVGFFGMGKIQLNYGKFKY